MSGVETEKPLEEVATTDEPDLEETPPLLPSVGERLRVARESLGLDLDAIATTLKLSKRQIEALEADDWAKLPGNTFTRGFVRNYARVLQLDPAVLLADLDTPVQEPPRLDLPHNTAAVMPNSGKVQRRDYAMVLAGLVLVAVAVVAYFVVPADVWQSKPREEPKAAAPVEATPLFPPASAVLNEPVSTSAASNEAPVVDPSGASATSASSTPPPVVSDSPAASSTASAAVSEKSLKFSFAQPSWVEVRDGTGQLVFSQLNEAGTEHAIEGRPPFSLVVGNAAHVKVRYKGRNIELQPRSKDDVARVTVE